MLYLMHMCLQPEKIKDLKNKDMNQLDILDDIMDTPTPKGRPRLFRKGVNVLHPLGWIAGTVTVAAITGSLLAPPTFAVAAGINTGIASWESLPTGDLPLDEALPQHTVLLDKNGNQFAQFFSENRINVKLEEVNPMFIEALLATEDVRFYENNGFDVAGNVRSVMNNVAGGPTQGASGITQQLVKTIRINNAKTPEEFDQITSRSYGEKLKELKYAIEVEEQLSKEEILTLYLNTVFFGHNAYGIGAASKAFFNTTPAELTPTQIAVLVGAINSPSMFDPFTNPEVAKERRNHVLFRMSEEGIITKEEEAKLAAEDTVLNEGTFKNGCADSAYPYYCEMVRDEIKTDKAFGETPEARENTLYKGGLTIKTALDPAAMDTAAAEAERAFAKDNRVGTGIAVVVPGTGHVAAIAQNRDYGQGEGQTELSFARSARQTGSSFKPITLATAMEQGIPATTKMESNSPYIPDPARWDSPAGGFANFGWYDYGNVDAYQATKMSMNIWYVKLMERTGVMPVAEMAKRLGADSIRLEGEGSVNPEALSLTLGAYVTSPLEMANVYATFASGGVKCNTIAITEVTHIETGEKLPAPDAKCHQAIMPNIANTISKVLQEPLKEGGSAYGKALEGRVAAAKTGTTNDWADAWMVGYTPQYATAVWTGDPRGGFKYPLTEFVMYGQYYSGGIAGDGATAAGPIWKSVMDGIHRGLPAKKFTAPNDAIGSSILARAIPDLTGMGRDQAMTTIIDNGYVPVINQETAGDESILEPNVVVSQSPTPGGNGAFGQEITITLSPGSDTSVLPPTPKEQ